MGAGVATESTVEASGAADCPAPAVVVAAAARTPRGTTVAASHGGRGRRDRCDRLREGADVGPGFPANGNERGAECFPKRINLADNDFGQYGPAHKPGWPWPRPTVPETRAVVGARRCRV